MAERQARYDPAVAWSRARAPVTEAGEDLLAERQRMEARHALERRQWETRFARYLLQRIKPLEAKPRTTNQATPPHHEQVA